MFAEHRKTPSATMRSRRFDGDDRARTGNLRLAKPALSPLSYVPAARVRTQVRPAERFLNPDSCPLGVGVPGLEPGTSALSELRSNRLSYTPDGLPVWRRPSVTTAPEVPGEFPVIVPIGAGVVQCPTARQNGRTGDSRRTTRMLPSPGPRQRCMPSQNRRLLPTRTPSTPATGVAGTGAKAVDSG